MGKQKNPSPSVRNAPFKKILSSLTFITMLKKWLLHFVLFTLCVVQVSALCPPGAMQGLTPFECYVPVRADGSWYMAEQDCEARGGKLASSTTAFLNAFYAKMLLETYDDEDCKLCILPDIMTRAKLKTYLRKINFRPCLAWWHKWCEWKVALVGR